MTSGGRQTRDLDVSSNGALSGRYISLKSAPAPDWLQYGVPRLKMQEHIDQRLKERAEREKINNPPATQPGGRGGY